MDEPRNSAKNLRPEKHYFKIKLKSPCMFHTLSFSPQHYNTKYNYTITIQKN